ncbi:hypothetical protein, partial [Mesorhizobium japonicum]|uniref:hypothetical protein n=1 Tax=Mesorhizobium japonicum TaxID=2066070 RepID=UPI003B5B0430
MSRLGKGVAVVALIGVLSIAVPVGVTTSAQARATSVSGATGLPSPRNVLDEDFENTATDPVGLKSYVGSDGQKYTADSAWLVNCSGEIRSGSLWVDNFGNCDQGINSPFVWNGDGGETQLAYALSKLNDPSDAHAEANRALMGYTID